MADEVNKVASNVEVTKKPYASLADRIEEGG